MQYKTRVRDDREYVYLFLEGKTVSIPPNVENVDYQEYLKWLADGNTPEPWNEEAV